MKAIAFDIDAPFDGDRALAQAACIASSVEFLRYMARKNSRLRSSSHTHGILTQAPMGPDALPPATVLDYSMQPLAGADQLQTQALRVRKCYPLQRCLLIPTLPPAGLSRSSAVARGHSTRFNFEDGRIASSALPKTPSPSLAALRFTRKWISTLRDDVSRSGQLRLCLAPLRRDVVIGISLAVTAVTALTIGRHAGRARLATAGCATSGQSDVAEVLR